MSAAILIWDQGEVPLEFYLFEDPDEATLKLLVAVHGKIVNCDDAPELDKLIELICGSSMGEDDGPWQAQRVYYDGPVELPAATVYYAGWAP